MAARAHEKYGTPAPAEQETNEARYPALGGSSDPFRFVQSAQWGMHAAAPISIGSRALAYAVTVSECSDWHCRRVGGGGERAAWAAGSSGRGCSAPARDC